MALARLAGQIAQETKRIAECLNRVQAVERDPYSTATEIQDAIALLDSANAQLGSLEDLYNQLDPTNDQQNGIRTDAIANQSALGNVKVLPTIYFTYLFLLIDLVSRSLINRIKANKL